jgi:hypothetical protein
MANVTVKCPECKCKVDVDDENRANICPICEKPFVTEDAVALYNGKKIKNDVKPKNNVFLSILNGLWFGIKCIGYLIYVITLLWLVLDLFDAIGGKKK